MDGNETHPKWPATSYSTMTSGFFALLDDITALVKASAASLDDIPAQVAKTTGKVSGIVIDDTAVSPKYVVGLDPSRELSIIYRIALKSLVNKLIILSPAALLLGYFAPWIITPILMLGGGYLCFEGYEKVHSVLQHRRVAEVQSGKVDVITPAELEKQRVTSAVRTDIILSAEIMAIAYSQLAGLVLVNQIAVLLAVAIFITILVYGVVGLIVKMDDIGMYLAQEQKSLFSQKIGRGIVTFMPHFLRVLGYVGTAAMLWVGAEIIAHGIPFTQHLLHDLEHALAGVPVLPWLAKALACGLFGLGLGWIIERIIALANKVLYS